MFDMCGTVTLLLFTEAMKRETIFFVAVIFLSLCLLSGYVSVSAFTLN